MSQAPVIVNCSLTDTDISNRLQQKGWRMRYATGTVEGTVIFPNNGPVFLIVQLAKTVLFSSEAQAALDPDFVKRLRKALQIHGNMYLITTSPLLGLTQLSVISLLQERLPEVRIIPVRDGKQCADSMCNVVKVLQSDTRSIIEQRYANTVTDMTEAVYQDVISSLPFDTSVVSALESSAQSVSALVRSTEQELLHAGLSPHDAGNVFKFFNEDKVVM